MSRLAILALCLFLAACSGGDAADEVRDESKLSADLEQRARSIEARAQEGVAAAEREAAADLERLNQEAAASATSTDAADADADEPAVPAK